ncbi:hypothetical protein [Petralouisia muris]|nr:hypothetical protein [Petralouisia muris]
MNEKYLDSYTATGCQAKAIRHILNCKTDAYGRNAWFYQHHAHVGLNLFLSPTHSCDIGQQMTGFELELEPKKRGGLPAR